MIPFEDLRINPILPIWIVAVVCVVLLLCKRKGVWPFIRQIILVILLFVLNLRIQIPAASVPIENEKMDAYVIFVIDDTISMIANDYDGDVEGMTRLDAAKRDCEHIITQFGGAKCSVIAFNNTASMISPYTEDVTYNISIINSVYPLPSLYGRGTSINVCKDLLEQTVKNAHDKMDGKVLLFFITDGEMNKGDQLESFKKVGKYVDGGAVLGYGTEEGGEMFLIDSITGLEEQISYYDKNYTKQTKSEYDPRNAKNLAKDMGLELIHREGDDDFDELEDFVEGIKEGEIVMSDGGTQRVYADIYYIFAIPVAVLLVVDYMSFKRKGSVK